MTDKAISPLRQRMIEDMVIRKLAPKTQHDYVQRVKNFAAFLGRSPDTASFEDVRRYQLHLASSGVGVPTLNQAVSTLRFFFRVTLKRHDIVEYTHFVHEPRKMPVVLNPEEVARLLDAAPGLKYKAALSVAYGAGLRAAEVVSLKVSDIDNTSRLSSRRSDRPADPAHMSRPALEVADIFRDRGPAWRKAHAGHVSLNQLKVMSAIESCRTAALGGHVARCEKCAHTQISYNSCRNRHCPKCQGAAAKEWLAAREADLLPVPYYHVVFTLPAAIADIAYQNKTVIYDLLFKASAETLTTIAADPKHLGARVGVTSVLHTWGSAMTHHPHIHMIVPGGGITLDGERWVACRPGFFLPVRVLSHLFRRLFLEKLIAAHQAGRLSFFGDHAALANPQAFAAYLAPLRRAEWVVYAKRPFGGPQAVLAYLSRYTHRVAIANSRLIACDRNRVTFRWKDYRAEGRDRQKVMTLTTAEFIRRFLIHVLPCGFHRIRHYGLLASGTRADNIARARRLLDIRAEQPEAGDDSCAEVIEPKPLSQPCPCCGGRMIIIETFQRGASPRTRPSASTAVIRIDTS